MPDPCENAEAREFHREFAMRCNNIAWELSTQPRSTIQDREMLDAAHASAWHWSKVGTQLNQMRATMLLAEVHALLGFGASAFTFAVEMRAYFLGNDTPDWELAFTHTIYAHAAYAAGRFADHRAAYEQASIALMALTDEEDRNIVTKTFDQVPRP